MGQDYTPGLQPQEAIGHKCAVLGDRPWTATLGASVRLAPIWRPEDRRWEQPQTIGLIEEIRGNAPIRCKVRWVGPMMGKPWSCWYHKNDLEPAPRP